MQLIEVPVEQPDVPSEPWTRGLLISLAKAHQAVPGTALRVSAVVNDCFEGCSIEHASVELTLCADGECTLQYVSYHEQNNGRIGAIEVLAKDLVAYANTLKLARAITAPEVIAASWMQAEGLGPTALLDLRPNTQVPIAPTEADAVALRAMIASAIADAYQSNTDDPSS